MKRSRSGWSRHPTLLCLPLRQQHLGERSLAGGGIVKLGQHLAADADDLAAERVERTSHSNTRRSEGAVVSFPAGMAGW